MAVAYVSVARTDEADTATVTLNKPASTAAGSILYATLGAQVSTAPNSVPSGWTLVDSETAGANQGQWVYWYRCTGSDAASWNWGWAASNYRFGSMTCWSGALSSGTPHEGAASNTGSGTTYSSITVNTTQSGRLVWISSTTDNTTVTQPSGFTAHTTGNDDKAALWASKDQVTTGAIATGTGSQLDATNNGMSAVAFLVIPDTGGGVPGNNPIPAYDSAGTALAFNTDPVNVVCPATLNAGDLPVLVVVWKSQITGTATTLSAPANWSLLSSYVNTAVNAGTDAGSMRTSVYIPTDLASLPAGGSNVSLDFNVAPSAGQARIMRFTKPAGLENHQWVASIAGGSDDTADNTWSVTGDVNPGIQLYDLVLISAGQPTDIAETWSSESVAATGATISALTDIQNVASATGTDSRFRLAYVTCTAGLATAAPVYTATTTGTTTNQKGTSAFVRIRLTGNPPAARIRGEMPSMRRHFRW